MKRHRADFAFITGIAIAFLLLPGFALASVSPAEVIRLTNIERVKEGLPALTENPLLTSAARAKNADMRAANYFAHRYDGKKPYHFAEAAGYMHWSRLGENLAQGFNTPEELVKAWMTSPTHRANIMSPHFTEIGLSVEGALVAQYFGYRR